MKFGGLKYVGTDYFTFFETSDKETQLHLLNFMQYIIENDVHEVLINNKDFGPSEVWLKWLSDTFCSVSYNSIMLKSGHRFNASFQPFYMNAFRDNVNIPKKLLSILKNFYVWSKGASIDNNMGMFSRFYPDFDKTELHEKFLSTHGAAYIRALEVHQYSKQYIKSTDDLKFVEIGAGAAVNVSLMKNVHKAKFIIIDLPDTIFVSYLYLKTLFNGLKIALPNDVDGELNFDQYDVIYLCPHQLDLIQDDMFDCAFNFSSFQEMPIEVVNNYVTLLERILKRGGYFVSCNQEVSRYIKNNRFDNYSLQAFEQKMYDYPPYQNQDIKNMGLDLKQFLYIGEKK